MNTVKLNNPNLSEGIAIKLPEDMNRNSRAFVVGYNGKKSKWSVSEYMNTEGNFKVPNKNLSDRCPVFVQNVRIDNKGNKVGKIFVPEKPESCVPTLSKDHKGRLEVPYRIKLFDEWANARIMYAAVSKGGTEKNEASDKWNKEISKHAKALGDRLKHNLKEGVDYQVDKNWVDDDLEQMYLQAQPYRSMWEEVEGHNNRSQQTTQNQAGYWGKVALLVMAIFVAFVGYFMVLNQHSGSSVRG